MLFDEKGLITPANEVAMTLAEFEERFVKAVPSTSTRHTIFSSYLHFVDRFRTEIDSSFTHWLNGSFVTNKTDPNDLDLVTFIDDAIYADKQVLIDGVFRLSGARQHFPGIDAYTVRRYPDSNQVGCSVAYLDTAYWRDLFAQTRPNRFGKRYRKGFVEIVYNG